MRNILIEIADIDDQIAVAAQGPSRVDRTGRRRFQR